MRKATRRLGKTYDFWSDRAFYLGVGVALGMGSWWIALGGLVGVVLGTWSRKLEDKQRWSFLIAPYDYASKAACEAAGDHRGSLDVDGFCNQCGDK